MGPRVHGDIILAKVDEELVGVDKSQTYKHISSLADDAKSSLSESYPAN